MTSKDERRQKALERLRALFREPFPTSLLATAEAPGEVRPPRAASVGIIFRGQRRPDLHIRIVERAGHAPATATIFGSGLVTAATVDLRSGAVRAVPSAILRLTIDKASNVPVVVG